MKKRQKRRKPNSNDRRRPRPNSSKRLKRIRPRWSWKWRKKLDWSRRSRITPKLNKRQKQQQRKPRRRKKTGSSKNNSKRSSLKKHNVKLKPKPKSLLPTRQSAKLKMPKEKQSKSSSNVRGMSREEKQ